MITSQDVADNADVRLQCAVKEHTCDCCGKLIVPGTLYWRTWYKDTGIVYKEHRDCEDLRSNDGDKP